MARYHHISQQIMQALMRAAQDPGHPHQAAAAQMVFKITGLKPPKPRP